MLGGDSDGRLGQLCLKRKETLEHRSQNGYFSSDPWAVWYGRCNILQASEASRCLSHANFLLFHRTIQEHMEDVWIKVTPSLLLEVLPSCALLPFAQSFVENFAAKLDAMADAPLAKEVAESPKLCQICQRSSSWCFFRSALVSRTVLLL